MNPEPEQKATAVADTIRIARTTMQALAETHVILEKDEFSALLYENHREMEAVMWSGIIDSYEKAAEQMSTVLSPERMRGFELAGRLLRGMRDASMEVIDREVDARLENYKK